MHDDLTILHAKPEQAFFGADYLFVGTSQSQLLGLKGLGLPCKLKSRSRSINLHKTQGFFTLGYVTLSSMKVLAVKSWLLFSGTNSYLPYSWSWEARGVSCQRGTARSRETARLIHNVGGFSVRAARLVFFGAMIQDCASGSREKKGYG